MHYIVVRLKVLSLVKDRFLSNLLRSYLSSLVAFWARDIFVIGPKTVSFVFWPQSHWKWRTLAHIFHILFLINLCLRCVYWWISSTWKPDAVLSSNCPVNEYEPEQHHHSLTKADWFSLSAYYGLRILSKPFSLVCKGKTDVVAYDIISSRVCVPSGPSSGNLVGILC
jgi:hypothetical protein